MSEPKKPFYLTTTLPYVNAKPHIGFALELVQADVIARWHARQGREVFFNTGTDEHGLKIQRNAQAAGLDTQAYADQNARPFQDLLPLLDIMPGIHFIRTSSPAHKRAAQEFWRRCLANGDIYKKNYKVRYCVGCELEKTDSDLLDGACPIHPNAKLEIIEEENYFFAFSKYQGALLDMYRANPGFVQPSWRLKEITNFVEAGLQDFSISRLKSKMPWGVTVPDDEEHVMYVWFDALINYISTLGWPDDGDTFEKFWGTAGQTNAVQIAGKDNLRQQASMWQAMLLSAGLPPSKQIIIHGFINSGGQKMSKSLGNVSDPVQLVQTYGSDAVRYYLLAEISPFEDGDFTIEKFETRYNADLANGLGNLVARTANLLEKYGIDVSAISAGAHPARGEVDAAMREYRYNEALAVVWRVVGQADETLSREKPWEQKQADKVQAMLEPVVRDIKLIAELLVPLLPEVAAKISAQFAADKITKGEALFPRV